MPPFHNINAMAKSKNFFGQRRGSTKALTYRIFRGLQITSQRATNVRNPHTNKQMMQRLKVPMVSNTRSVLGDIANHSFQSTPYGYQSLQRFSSLNLSKDQLHVSAYVPKDVMDTGVADYIISDGSLTSAYNFTEIKSGKCYAHFTNGQSVNIFDNVTNGPLTPGLLAFIRDVMGLQDNDQLTFILQKQGDDYTFIGADGMTTGHYHRFIISRIIIDLAKTSQWTVDSFTNGNELLMHDGYVYFKLSNSTHDKYISVWPMDEKAVMTAGACVFSRKGYMTWQRSKSRFVVDKSIDYSNMSAENLMATYMANMTESTKYLNTGMEGVEISGGIVKNDDLPGSLDSNTHSHNQDKGKG